MSFLSNKNIICDGCICHILDNSDIYINNSIFHNNICFLHYKYIKIDNITSLENELYLKYGRNFFVDLIEYNIIKHKIRDVTIKFLVKYIIDFFNN